MYHLLNYVRTLRSALSHAELAQLIGQRSPSAISYYESGERLPTLEMALALQVVFGKAPREIFPSVYENIEEAVMNRAVPLRMSLEGETDQKSEAKRRLLDRMASRTNNNSAGA